MTTENPDGPTIFGRVAAIFGGSLAGVAFAHSWFIVGTVLFVLAALWQNELFQRRP